MIIIIIKLVIYLNITFYRLNEPKCVSWIPINYSYLNEVNSFYTLCRTPFKMLENCLYFVRECSFALLNFQFCSKLIFEHPVSFVKCVFSWHFKTISFYVLHPRFAAIDRHMFLVCENSEKRTTAAVDEATANDGGHSRQ